jgi:hypothetical protein
MIIAYSYIIEHILMTIIIPDVAGIGSINYCITGIMCLLYDC